MTRWGPDRFPPEDLPWITRAAQQAPWWRDGLVWTVVLLVAIGVLVGLAIGSVIYE